MIVDNFGSGNRIRQLPVLLQHGLQAGDPRPRRSPPRRTRGIPGMPWFHLHRIFTVRHRMYYVSKSRETFSISGKERLHMESMKELSLSEMEGISGGSGGYPDYPPEKDGLRIYQI